LNPNRKNEKNPSQTEPKPSQTGFCSKKPNRTETGLFELVLVFFFFFFLFRFGEEEEEEEKEVVRIKTLNQHVHFDEMFQFSLTNGWMESYHCQMLIRLRKQKDKMEKLKT